MIIGITGSFGTGKTTVSRMFKRLGARGIDADKIAHRFIRPAARKNLAKIVFKRKVYIEFISKILHPLIIAEIRKEIRRFNAKKTIVVIDAPLLIESGLDKIIDFLIVVKTKRVTQIRRVQKRTGLARGEVLKRINFQMALSQKERLADFVIDNNAGLKETRKQVEMIWRTFRTKCSLSQH